MHALFPKFMGVLLKGFQLFLKIKQMKHFFLDSFHDECFYECFDDGMNAIKTECFIHACKGRKVL